jgi:mannosyltransferase OCH1-like enzyme
MKYYITDLDGYRYSFEFNTQSNVKLPHVEVFTYKYNLMPIIFLIKNNQLVSENPDNKYISESAKLFLSKAYKNRMFL